MEKIHMSEDKAKNKKSDDKKLNDKKLKRKKYLAEYRQNNTDVRIAFTNKNYEILEKVATKQGLTLASFIRLATMEQAKNLYLFPKDLEDEIKKAVRNMRGIGNNINQVAKYANEQGYTSPESMEVIFNYLKKLEDEIKNIKQIITEKKCRDYKK